MRDLKPSLETIERDLFGPSDHVIARWATGDSDLPREVVAALEADPEAVARRDELDEAEALFWQGDYGRVAEDAAIPREMEDLIRRRVAARRAFGEGAQELSPGTIVRLDSVSGPKAPPGGELRRPVAVLLSEYDPAISLWRGWLVAPETDYVSWWDILLGPDDDPFDPIAAMIQVWNPVCIQAADGTRGLARLKSRRLKAVRALAREFIEGAASIVAVPRPGAVGERRINGLTILTGTPLGAATDPRRAYQRLYGRVAEMIGTQVPERQDEQRINALIARIVRNLEQWAAGAGLALSPTLPIAQPLGTQVDQGATNYRFGDQLELRLLLHGEDMALQIHIDLIGPGPVDVVLRTGERITHKSELTPEKSEADFFLGIRDPYVLSVKLPDKETPYDIPLT